MQSEARILVIDDDEVVRDALSMALEQEGYVVDSAANGKEAIEKSHANLYNLAIVDCRLPDVEGTKLLGKLRETEPKMRKIMLTGFPSMENAIEALNEHADAFFVKPVNIELLIKKISELLKEQKKTRTLIEYARKAMKIAEETNVTEQVTT
jgi:DNA-binding NtrC family response regulator